MARTAPLLAAALLLAPAGARAGETLAEALARAVDLPDPAKRKAAAAALLARPDATMEALLAAMRAFGGAPPPRPGTGVEAASLWNGKETEPAEVWVHVPRSLAAGKRAPLLLHLHGAGSAGEEAAMWKGAAEALGMIVVAPTDRGADAGYRFTPRERALSLAALRWARRRFDVDEDRVFLAGVSRGGHLAWDLALRRADLFAAAAPMIGGPRMSNGQGENNLRYLENARALPIRDLQGAGDDPLLLENLRLAFARLAGWKADAVLLEQAGLGHEFDFKAVDWAAFLGGARRDPRRAEVVRACAAPGEGRALWAEVLRTAREVEEAFPFRADPKAWAALSREEQRRRFQEEVERRTARLAVRREAPGRFSAESSRVESFRLLLEESAVEPGKPVELRWKGRTLARPFRPDRRVLVEEFLERFDRSFLPVAEAVF